MKFRNKTTFEANQFYPEGLPWPEGVVKINNNFVVKTAWGWLPVNSGDWVMELDDNEYYPCDPEFFKARYEKV